MGENALRLSERKIIKIGRGDISILFYLCYEDWDNIKDISLLN